MMLRRLVQAWPLLATGCFGSWVGTMDTDATSSTTADVTTSSTDATTTAPTTSTAGSSTSIGAASSESSTEGSTTTAGLLCDHVDILVVFDVSASMAPYTDGIRNSVIALGASQQTIFDQVAGYHVGFTLNAPVALNADAPAPEGETCTQLGALVRPRENCRREVMGRPYLTEEDNVILSLGCLAAPFTSAPLPPEYEGRLTLAALEATLRSDEDPALSTCNDGFHSPGDPLLVVLVIDDEDASRGLASSYIPGVVASQGSDDLSNMAVLLIGADDARCEDEGDGGEPSCDAIPSCRVGSFLDAIFSGLPGEHVRRMNLCRALDDDPAEIAADIDRHLTDLSAVVCG